MSINLRSRSVPANPPRDRSRSPQLLRPRSSSLSQGINSGSQAVSRLVELIGQANANLINPCTYFVCILPNCLHACAGATNMPRHVRTSHDRDACPEIDANGNPCPFVLTDARQRSAHYKDAHPEYTHMPRAEQQARRSKIGNVCLDCFVFHYNERTLPYYANHFNSLGVLPNYTGKPEMVTSKVKGSLVRRWNPCCVRRPRIANQLSGTRARNDGGATTTRTLRVKKSGSSAISGENSNLGTIESGPENAVENNLETPQPGPSSGGISKGQINHYLGNDSGQHDKESVDIFLGDLQGEVGESGGAKHKKKKKKSKKSDKKKVQKISSQESALISSLDHSFNSSASTIELHSANDTDTNIQDVSTPATTDASVQAGELVDWQEKYNTVLREMMEKTERVNELEQSVAALQGELASSQEKINEVTTELHVAKEHYASAIPGAAFQKANISKISSDNVSLRTKLIIERQKSEGYRTRFQTLMESLPNFAKLPPIVTKLETVQKTPSKEDLLKVRDLFIATLTYTMIQLESDITTFQANLKRASQGLETYSEQAAKFMSSVQRATSSVTSNLNKAPDTLLDKDGVKCIKSATSFHPPREPSEYPGNYNGTVAVVDGASVLTSHGEKDYLWARVRKVNPERPKPRYQILVLWLDEMIRHQVFRGYIVVLREDMVFAPDSEDLLLENDEGFSAFMEKVCHPESNIQMIIVPSPCYDDLIIVMVARELLGVIISRDKYRDLWDPKYEGQKTNVVRGFLNELGDFLNNPDKGNLIGFTYMGNDRIRLNPDPNGPRGRNLEQMLKGFYPN